VRPAAILFLLTAGAALAQERCTVERPTRNSRSLTWPAIRRSQPIPLRRPGATPGYRYFERLQRPGGLPALRTQVRGFWTSTHLYLLFSCPYNELNLFLPPLGGGPRDKLWDRDVVEIFLGEDWTRIGHYREFEIAPTGDWIDLAIDLDRDSYDQSWRSGWKTAARIDQAAHAWYAAVRIPLSAVGSAPVKQGSKWRANLYRIEGQGPDARRHFLCWQPTCVVHRDPNHVPENFGTLVFAGRRMHCRWAAAVRSAVRRLPWRGRHGWRARTRHRQRKPRATSF